MMRWTVLSLHAHHDLRSNRQDHGNICAKRLHGTWVCEPEVGAELLVLDSDSDNESSDGFSPEDPQGLLRRFESGSKHSLSDLDEDSANELSTTPPNLGSFGGRAKLKKRVTSKDSLQSNEDAEKPAPRPADDDDLDDVPDAGPVFADDLDDELGRLSLRRARRGSDEDKRRPGSSRV